MWPVGLFFIETVVLCRGTTSLVVVYTRSSSYPLSFIHFLGVLLLTPPLSLSVPHITESHTRTPHTTLTPRTHTKHTTHSLSLTHSITDSHTHTHSHTTHTLTPRTHTAHTQCRHWLHNARGRAISTEGECIVDWQAGQLLPPYNRQRKTGEVLSQTKTSR